MAVTLDSKNKYEGRNKIKLHYCLMLRTLKKQKVNVLDKIIGICIQDIIVKKIHVN